MEISKAKLQDEIEKLMSSHPEYGVRRIHESLKKSIDAPVSIKRVRKFMRGLDCHDENVDKENSTKNVNVERVEQGNILKQRLRNKPTKVIIDNQNDNEEDADSDFVPEGEDDHNKVDVVETLLEEQEELMHDSFINEVKLEIADTPVSSKNILNTKRKTKCNAAVDAVDFSVAELDDQDELYVPPENDDNDNEEEPFEVENNYLNDAVDNLKAMIGSFKSEQHVYESETKEAIASAIPEKKLDDFSAKTLVSASPVPEKHKRRGSSLVKLLSEQELLKQKLKAIQAAKAEDVAVTPELPTQTPKQEIKEIEAEAAADDKKEVESEVANKETSANADIKTRESEVSFIDQQSVASPLPSPPKLTKSDEVSVAVQAHDTAPSSDHQDAIQNIMEDVDINAQTVEENEDRVDSFKFWCFGFCSIL